MTERTSVGSYVSSFSGEPSGHSNTHRGSGIEITIEDGEFHVDAFEEIEDDDDDNDDDDEGDNDDE
jgi:hypothetical protein